MQPRPLAAAQHLCQQIELGVALGEQRRRTPGKIQPGQLDAVREQQPALTVPFGLGGRGGRRRRRSARNLLEVAACLGECGGCRHVARDCKRCVARMVVGGEESLYVFQAGGPQVVGITDRHPVIRMSGRVQSRHERHRYESVGAVLVILAPLVEHHLALRLELLLRERRQEIPHAVRFHPQGALERTARHHLPVVRAVGAGRPVQGATHLLERMEVAAVEMRRPFEHQVLEQVGEPGAAGLLVLRADVVPEVDRNDGAAAILVHDHVEPVVECLFLVGDLHGLLHRAPKSRPL